MVYHLGGLQQEALDAINAGLQLNPEKRNSVMLKATILSALGRQDEARAASNMAEFLPEGNWSEHAPVK
jgi:Flp pilus assembly protein TadD